MKRFLLALPLLLAVGWQADWDWTFFSAAKKEKGPDYLTFTFVSTVPATVTLGADYAGPASALAPAQYDSGDGVWRDYDSKTITMRGQYLSFRGDWRTAAGTYQNMFYDAFATSQCEMRGQLKYDANNKISGYDSILRNCSAIVAIIDNPLPLIEGAPMSRQFYCSFYMMNGVTNSLPAGFLDTSRLSGPAATFMFELACRNLSARGPLPDGFLDMRGFTGSVPAYFIPSACRGMAYVTGTFPVGFLDMRGMSGDPTASAFKGATYGMSNIQGGNIYFSSDISFTSANVNSITQIMAFNTKWTGTVFWGDTPITTAIPTPDTRNYAFVGCTLKPNYATIHANWK